MSSSGSTVKWNGAAAKRAVEAGGRDGVAAAARLVFEATQRDVPVESGALKQSGRVTVDGLQAEVTYGEGLPDDRASIIHEKLEIRHDSGSAKYLENPTAASARQAFAVIAAGIRRKL